MARDPVPPSDAHLFGLSFRGGCRKTGLLILSELLGFRSVDQIDQLDIESVTRCRSNNLENVTTGVLLKPFPFKIVLAPISLFGCLDCVRQLTALMPNRDIAESSRCQFLRLELLVLRLELFVLRLEPLDVRLNLLDMSLHALQLSIAARVNVPARDIDLVSGLRFGVIVAILLSITMIVATTTITVLITVLITATVGLVLITRRR